MGYTQSGRGGGGPRSGSRLRPRALGTDIPGWLWLLGSGSFIQTQGTKCTKVFRGGERGAPCASPAVVEGRGGAPRLPPHLVVVAHHPLDVEEFVAQGFGLQLLRLVVGALKGSTGPASAPGATGRGLQPGPGGGGMASTPPPPWLHHTNPAPHTHPLQVLQPVVLLCDALRGERGGGGVTTSGHHGQGPRGWVSRGDEQGPCTLQHP